MANPVSNQPVNIRAKDPLGAAKGWAFFLSLVLLSLANGLAGWIVERIYYNSSMWGTGALPFIVFSLLPYILLVRWAIRRSQNTGEVVMNVLWPALLIFSAAIIFGMIYGHNACHCSPRPISDWLQ